MNDNNTKTMLVDPPGGWRYGFPKLYDPLPDEDFKSWLIRRGYPRETADFAANWSRMWPANDTE